MSEQLLEAVIHLFSIIARLDGVGEKERSKMRNLLNYRLNKEVISEYMDLFDMYCSFDLGDKKAGLEEITKIAKQINGQISRQQKIFLLSELTQLIYADNILSEEENLALHNIGRELKIDDEELKAVQNFVAGKNIEDFDSVNILIITGRSEDVPPKCQKIISEGAIDGFIAVLYLKSIKPFFLRYMGKSGIFLNQIPAECGKVEIVPAGSSLRSNRFRAIYYSDILSHFRSESAEAEISFRADQICYKFKNGNVGLSNISLSEQNGNLIGVMGASGSGKSTLFSVLNGNEKPSSGNVRINGINIHKDRKKIEGLIGYVPQDDLLMEDLTVFQNLYYAAKLCFDHYSDRQITELVDKTLISLGLYETKQLRVGNPLQKIISGGQRKRLNIGLELLREPMVLYVDEPTSGLSSRDSENIMDLLKELALRGKLVFVVIHQPSSDIFKMFDRLLILDVGGYPIYYGNPIEAVGYFREAARLVDKQTGSCSTCGNVNAEQIFNIIETRVVDEYGRHTEQRKYTPETWHEIFNEKTELPKSVSLTEKPKAVLHIPNRIRQLAIFAARDLKSKMANRQYVLINFLEAPLLALILAVLLKYFPGKPAPYIFQENVNIPAYIFIGVIVALFMGLTVSAEEIIKDKKILKRESFLHLSKGSYIASKLLLLFALSAVQTAAFVLIGNRILSVEGMYFSYWWVLFSASCFANVLGLNISASFNSAVTIYILIPILIIPQILLSGVVVQFDQLNPSFGAKSRVPFIGDMMISRWAFEALMVNQFKNNKYEQQFYELDKAIANADYNTVYYLPKLESVLDYAYLNKNSKDKEVLAEAESDIQLFKNEIHIQLAAFGKDKFRYADRLSLEQLDETVYNESKNFLSTLYRIHINRHTSARKVRDKKIKSMTSSPKKADAFNKLKQDYTNEQVNVYVFDNREKSRITEQKGRLVRQIYPIFAVPEPENFFDFRTMFFMPEKYFAGRYFDTPVFNTLMMWSMTLLLIVALYFDVLRKIVHAGSGIKLKKR